MEHRWGKRTALDLPARLDARPGVLAMGQLRNASLSGAYVKTIARISPLARLHLELEWVYWRRAEPERIPAYVARVDGEGMALEWCEFAPPAIRRLLEHLAVQSAHCTQRKRIDRDVDSFSLTASVQPFASAALLNPPQAAQRQGLGQTVP